MRAMRTILLYHALTGSWRGKESGRLVGRTWGLKRRFAVNVGSESEKRGAQSWVNREFERRLKDNCGVPDEAILVVSLSGGVDSTALLHLIMEKVKKSPGLHVQAVHFNHKLRKNADRDDAFCHQLARKYDLPIERLEWTKKEGRNCQEAARKWRRESLEKILQGLKETLQVENGYIVTAHHKDDSIENAIWSSLRGSRLLHHRRMQWNDGNYIKPLLEFKKSDLIAYMTSNGNEWVEDESNKVELYARNAIRLSIVPKLKEFCGEKKY